MSELVPIYKGKGDVLECSSSRGIKLLEHGMKVAERVLERRLKQTVEIDKMQFGFTPGTGTTHAIFIARQLQKRYSGKHRKLWWAFVDLEKAFDRVSRKVVEWTMRKLGVEEWLVRAVMAMYKHARTRIRSYDGSVSEWFGVNVGVHQGSVLSPLLFIIVMKAVTHNVREGLPWEMLYADDLVLVGKCEEELKEKLRKWNECLKDKGLKVNEEKTKVMCESFGTGTTQVVGNVKHPYSVCLKGVAVNSIRCTQCIQWVHASCSRVKGSLKNVESSFICRRCKGELSETRQVNSLHIQVPAKKLENFEKLL